MSPSLIGRSVSSAFRLTTTSASMSLAGSCFLFGIGTKGRSIMGCEDESRTIFAAALLAMRSGARRNSNL
jgi:hypothetical protein